MKRKNSDATNVVINAGTVTAIGGSGAAVTGRGAVTHEEAGDKEPARTGDETQTVFWIWLMAGAFAAVLLLAVQKRKNKKGNFLK